MFIPIQTNVTVFLSNALDFIWIHYAYLCCFYFRFICERVLHAKELKLTMKITDGNSLWIHFKSSVWDVGKGSKNRFWSTDPINYLIEWAPISNDAFECGCKTGEENGSKRKTKNRAIEEKEHLLWCYMWTVYCICMLYHLVFNVSSVSS